MNLDAHSRVATRHHLAHLSFSLALVSIAACGGPGVTGNLDRDTSAAPDTHTDPDTVELDDDTDTSAATDTRTDPDTSGANDDTDLSDGADDALADTSDAAGDTLPSSDSMTADTRADTETVSCGHRECGYFSGQFCGSCNSKPGTICGPAGRCEVPRVPLGSFCGITAQCNPTSADFPNCINDQCASGMCLSHTPGVRYLFMILRDWATFSHNSVCTESCTFHDTNNDGVSDALRDECTPADVVDGPAGNRFRCANFAGVNAEPVGLCVPGTTFAPCSSNRDCPAGEGCELTSIRGELTRRCVANYKAGSWGGAVGTGGACNDDPAQGAVNFCTSGYCDTSGCATTCAGDSDCDTTPFPGVCSGATCTGSPGTTCAKDLDCSTFECGTLYLNETDTLKRCSPKD